MRATPRSVGTMVVLGLLLSACIPGSRTEPDTPGKIGFIFIAERDDLGYTQAAWEGSDAVARAFPDLSVLRAGSVPETKDAEAAMERQIRQGARILFATSYGHLPYAYAVAKRHPDVIVVHQGGTEPTPRLNNFGTYWAATHEQVYLAGIAAGAATTSNQLGFVAAFPIPATFSNVNAFTLGARSVESKATTHVEFTGDWCNPTEQTAAAQRLLATTADVMTQHQDCTGTILKAAETAGVASIGYHSDGSDVAPKGWLVGSVWDWGATFTEIVRAALSGGFRASRYNGDLVKDLTHKVDPFILTEFGSAVSASTRERIAKARDAIAAGWSPFQGPLHDRDGTIRVTEGSTLSNAQILMMDYFVRGVEGDIPTN